jgi:hypothetical protein
MAATLSVGQAVKIKGEQHRGIHYVDAQHKMTVGPDCFSLRGIPLSVMFDRDQLEVVQNAVDKPNRANDNVAFSHCVFAPLSTEQVTRFVARELESTRDQKVVLEIYRYR